MRKYIVSFICAEVRRKSISTLSYYGTYTFYRVIKLKTFALKIPCTSSKLTNNCIFDWKSHVNNLMLFTWTKCATFLFSVNFFHFFSFVFCFQNSFSSKCRTSERPTLGDFNYQPFIRFEKEKYITPVVCHSSLIFVSERVEILFRAYLSRSVEV